MDEVIIDIGDTPRQSDVEKEGGKKENLRYRSQQITSPAAATIDHS
jgi:hypothetical protein